MKSSVKIALCGIIAALSAVFMFLSGVIPTATIALPALAGVFTIPVAAMLGTSWGFGVYLAVSVLSFITAPDREAALIYVLFFGYYPVLFGVLCRIKNTVLRWLAKLVIFNAAAVAEFFLSIYVLGVSFDDAEFLRAFAPYVLLVLANIVFVIYDIALRRLIDFYFAKLHYRLKKLLRRG